MTTDLLHKTRSVIMPARDGIPNYELWYEVCEAVSSKKDSVGPGVRGYVVGPNAKYPKWFKNHTSPTVQLGFREDLGEAIRDAEYMITDSEEWVRAQLKGDSE